MHQLDPCTNPERLTIVSVGEHPREAPQYLSRLATAEGAKQRFSLETRLPAHDRSVPLLPEGFENLREHDRAPFWSTFAVRGDVAVFVEGRPSGTEVTVMANTQTDAVEVMAEIRTRHCRVQDDDVHAIFWMMSTRGVSATPQRLRTEPLDALLVNYPTNLARSLLELSTFTAPTDAGRLLLWHGPPGTGKTSAALGLLHAWRGWCDADIVTDPERMFTDPSYLLEVLARPSGGDRWKLIVCEDADEYLRSDARSRSGPGLGRLLNATDGLLGRGAKAMVLLTTNDEAGRLHPAITRPGRCMSLLEFGTFTPQQASAWLGSPIKVHSTLAELFHLRAGRVSQQEQPVSTGAYL